MIRLNTEIENRIDAGGDLVPLPGKEPTILAVYRHESGYVRYSRHDIPPSVRAQIRALETEDQLWERLLGAGQAPTCLVVSHRRPVLKRADHVIVLRGGRIEGEGRLDDLLSSCEEMQRLWRGEVRQT